MHYLSNPRHGLVALGVVAAASALLGASPAAATTTPISAYGGYAYGTTAHVGSYATSGRSAVTKICTTRSGVAHVNTTARTTIPNVGRVGAVTTRITTSDPAAGKTARTTTSTAAAKLLGAINATEITTSASVTHTSHGFVQSGQTSFGSLSISGRPGAPLHPSVNQKITVPGVATIVFNHQVKTHRFGNYAITVVAMTVTIPKDNTMHLPAGLIVIGRGTASLHQPTVALANGAAYGTRVTVASLAGSGRTAAVYLPCGGTNGASVSNHVAAGKVPHVLATGADTSTGYSTDDGTTTVAHTANRVAGINLFAGKVKARVITVTAQAARATTLRRGATATIAGLTVNGTSRSGNAPANTKITIPNLGTLWIHRVLRTANGIEVRGLDLVLSVTKNGLKKGTHIIVASAYASVAAH